MSRLARPQKVYDFTAHARRQPTAPPPGDRIDAQLQNHADAIVAAQLAIERLDAPVTLDKLDQAVIDALARKAADLVGQVVDQALNAAHAAGLSATAAASSARQAAHEAQPMLAHAQALVAQERDALALLERHADFIRRIDEKVDYLAARPAPREPTLPPAMLGPDAGGFFNGDEKSATATAADYAEVAITWAEWMGPGGIGMGGPAGSSDTIPANVLSVNAISGDHWSSRWWAHQAAAAVGGQLFYLYLGPFPTPPVTAPGGGSIPIGGLYYDTSTGQMYVWNGTSWQSITAPAKAATMSLFYSAALNQTVFPTATADLFGMTYTLNAASPEGVEVFLNGVRIVPNLDYTVDPVASTITLLQGATAGAVLGVDVLVNPNTLAPGAVLTGKLMPIAPDGVAQQFPLVEASTGRPATAADASQLFVTVDGVAQEPGVDFSIDVTGGDIVFVTAPTADAKVFIVMLFRGADGSGGSSAPPPGPPASATLPLPDVTPHGGAIVGQTLSCSQGFWSNIPTSYAYQWRRGGANISGAIASSYTLVNADAALNVDCVVTATNSVGSNSATSNAISVAPLNPYPATNLKALYATRQLGSVTKCVRIRRASDNAQQDIGFVTGNFDIASYNAFVAGTQGFVVTWYDQSGNGFDAAQANVNAQPSMLIVNGRAHLTFEGQLLAAASSALANGDQTVGMIGWSGTGSGQQIPLADFGSSGWFLLANHGAPKNPGYYCDGNTYTDATGVNMMAASLMRWAVRRASGVATVYLNGTAVKTSAAGATNVATGSTLVVGGYGSTPSWQGIISEAFVYSTAVSTTVLGQIDASQNAYYTGLDLATPYAGGTSSVQIGASDTLSFGNVLQKDQGSPWTAFGAIQIWGQTTNAEVLFTNANAAPASTCYELWVDPLGRLRVRLINHFGNNLFLGVIGTPAASLIDGKKHVIAASYDGGSPATISNIKMYVDGVPVTASYEQTNTLGALSIVAAGQNMFVGTQVPAGPNMCGPISFFQIDKVARSAAYIATYHPGSATPLPPADANTDMRLLFLEGSGTAVHDTSANGFVGALSSSGLWAP